MKTKYPLARPIMVASVLAINILMLIPARTTAAEYRNLAFEKKSSQWMLQTRDADDAVKAGNLSEAEKIYKTIIADRINYHLDLSSERYALAHLYESQGKNEMAEALYKINLKQREEEDGAKGYTVQFPLNEYANFLDKTGRKDEAKTLRDRANAIELAANKQGDEELQKSKQRKRQRHS